MSGPLQVHTESTDLWRIRDDKEFKKQLKQNPQVIQELIQTLVQDPYLKDHVNIYFTHTCTLLSQAMKSGNPENDANIKKVLLVFNQIISPKDKKTLEKLAQSAIKNAKVDIFKETFENQWRSIPSTIMHTIQLEQFNAITNVNELLKVIKDSKDSAKRFFECLEINSTLLAKFSENERFEIASTLVTKFPDKVCNNIKAFSLNYDQRMTIAKSAVTQSKFLNIKYSIHKFDFEKADKLTIAQLDAKTHPKDFILANDNHIYYEYDINEIKSLKKIALTQLYALDARCPQWVHQAIEEANALHNLTSLYAIMAGLTMLKALNYATTDITDKTPSYLLIPLIMTYGLAKKQNFINTPGMVTLRSHVKALSKNWKNNKLSEQWGKVIQSISETDIKLDSTLQLLNNSLTSTRVIQNLKLINGNITISKSKNDFRAIQNILNGDEPSDVLASKVQEYSGFPVVNSEKFDSTFGKSRNPNAINQYVASFISDELLYEIYQDSVSQFFYSVIDGNFHTLRYDPEKNIHLKAINQLDPTILSKWQNGFAEKKCSEIPLLNRNVQIDNQQEFIQSAIALDKEHDYSALNFFYTLSEPALQKKWFAKTNRAISLAEKNGDFATKKTLETQVLLAKITSGQLTPQNFDSTFNTLFQNLNLPIDHPISIALEKLKLAFLPSMDNTNDMELIFVDTDNSDDILLCGSEVSGSCVDVDGLPSNNRGLLGYLLNGQNRMLAIKDEKTGEIKARAMFRLLINQDTQKPVLFMEYIYPQNISSVLEEKMQSFASQRAQHYGLDLYYHYLNQGKETNDILVSKGGLSPVDYVDSNEQRIVEGSKYTIRNAFVF